MSTLRQTFLCIAASLLAVSSLSAGMLTVTNPSFELSTGYNGGSTSTIPGWAPPPGQGTYGQVANVTSQFTLGLSGSNALYVGGLIGQQIVASFVTGAQYTFTVDVGNPTGVGRSDNGSFVFGFRNADNSDFLPQSSGGLGFVDPDTITAIPDGTFQTFSVTYTAAATDNGKPIVIAFNDFYYGSNTPNFSGSPSFYLDNVTLGTTAPEPSTYVMCFLGLSVFAFARFRRLERFNSNHSPDGR